MGERTDRRAFLGRLGALVGGAAAALALPPAAVQAAGRLWAPVARRPEDLPRCASCGERQGRCLAPGRPRPVDVTCRCEPSRCGRCGAVVHPHRITGHYYDEASRRVVHVPWFAAITHACGATSRLR